MINRQSTKSNKSYSDRLLSFADLFRTNPQEVVSVEDMRVVSAPTKECLLCYEKFHDLIQICDDTKHQICDSCLLNYVEMCVYGTRSKSEGTIIPCPFEPEACEPLSQNKSVMENVQSLWARSPKYKQPHPEITRDIDAAVALHLVVQMQTHNELYVFPTPDCNNAQFIDLDRFKLDEGYYKYEAFPTNLRWRSKRSTLRKRLEQTKVWKYLPQSIRNEPTPETRFLQLNGVDLRKYKCAKCLLDSCLLCRRYWKHDNLNHDNVTCKEFKKVTSQADQDHALTDDAIQQKIAAKVMQRCPNCSAVIEKNGGCVYMDCTECKRCFCWNCNIICQHGYCPNRAGH